MSFAACASSAGSLTGTGDVVRRRIRQWLRTMVFNHAPAASGSRRSPMWANAVIAASCTTSSASSGCRSSLDELARTDVVVGHVRTALVGVTEGGEGDGAHHSRTSFDPRTKAIDPARPPLAD